MKTKMTENKAYRHNMDSIDSKSFSNIKEDLLFQKACIDSPIIIIRDLVNHPEISLPIQQFSLDMMEKTYGGQQIKVMSQKIDACGWNLSNDNTSYYQNTTLSQYVHYHKALERLFDDECMNYLTQIYSSDLNYSIDIQHDSEGVKTKMLPPYSPRSVHSSISAIDSSVPWSTLVIDENTTEEINSIKRNTLTIEYEALFGKASEECLLLHQMLTLSKWKKPKRSAKRIRYESSLVDEIIESSHHGVLYWRSMNRSTYKYMNRTNLFHHQSKASKAAESRPSHSSSQYNFLHHDNMLIQNAVKGGSKSRELASLLVGYKNVVTNAIAPTNEGTASSTSSTRVNTSRRQSNTTKGQSKAKIDVFTFQQQLGNQIAEEVSSLASSAMNSSYANLCPDCNLSQFLATHTNSIEAKEYSFGSLLASSYSHLSSMSRQSLDRELYCSICQSASYHNEIHAKHVIEWRLWQIEDDHVEYVDNNSLKSPSTTSRLSSSPTTVCVAVEIRIHDQVAIISPLYHESSPNQEGYQAVLNIIRDEFHDSGRLQQELLYLYQNHIIPMYCPSITSSPIEETSMEIITSTVMLKDLFTGWIKFGCNIDLGNWNSQLRLLHKSLPEWLMFRSKYDILGKLRQDVEGVNFPQVYLKVPGVWTGGHEENLRLRSVNANLGPGSSEWFGIEVKYLPILRDQVQKLSSIDILRDEGLWYPDPRWLHEWNIPYTHGIQYAGDIVVLRGDTLHWVRSLGFATHVSWNFGYFDSDQIGTSMERYEINYQFTVTGPKPYQNIIPMKTLLLDLTDILTATAGTGIGTGTRGADGQQQQVVVVQQYQSVWEDINLLRFVLSDIASSVYNYRYCLEDAYQLTGLIPQQEHAGAMVVHCDNPSCKCEIFEAYLQCEYCGYLCLRCTINGNGCCKTNHLRKMDVSEESLQSKGLPIYPHCCIAGSGDSDLVSRIPIAGCYLIYKSPYQKLVTTLSKLKDGIIQRYPAAERQINEIIEKCAAVCQGDANRRRIAFSRKATMYGRRYPFHSSFNSSDILDPTQANQLLAEESYCSFSRSGILRNHTDVIHFKNKIDLGTIACSNDMSSQTVEMCAIDDPHNQSIRIVSSKAAMTAAAATEITVVEPIKKKRGRKPKNPSTGEAPSKKRSVVQEESLEKHTDVSVVDEDSQTGSVLDTPPQQTVLPLPATETSSIPEVASAADISAEVENMIIDDGFGFDWSELPVLLPALSILTDVASAAAAQPTTSTAKPLHSSDPPAQSMIDSSSCQSTAVNRSVLSHIQVPTAPTAAGSSISSMTETVFHCDDGSLSSSTDQQQSRQSIRKRPVALQESISDDSSSDDDDFSFAPMSRKTTLPPSTVVPPVAPILSGNKNPPVIAQTDTPPKATPVAVSTIAPSTAVDSRDSRGDTKVVSPPTLNIPQMISYLQSIANQSISLESLSQSQLAALDTLNRMSERAPPVTVSVSDDHSINSLMEVESTGRSASTVLSESIASSNSPPTAAIVMPPPPLQIPIPVSTAVAATNPPIPSPYPLQAEVSMAIPIPAKPHPPPFPMNLAALSMPQFAKAPGYYGMPGSHGIPMFMPGQMMSSNGMENVSLTAIPLAAHGIPNPHMMRHPHHPMMGFHDPSHGLMRPHVVMDSLGNQYTFPTGSIPLSSQPMDHPHLAALGSMKPSSSSVSSKTASTLLSTITIPNSKIKSSQTTRRKRVTNNENSVTVKRTNISKDLPPVSCSVGMMPPGNLPSHLMDTSGMSALQQSLQLFATVSNPKYHEL